MFRPYYKFIDVETDEVSYTRHTKVALKIIRSNLGKYKVVYVHNKGYSHSLIYIKKFIYVQHFSKAQRKYCHNLFNNTSITFVTSLKDKISDASLSKYQKKKQTKRTINYFNRLSEAGQTNFIRLGATEFKAKHSIDEQEFSYYVDLQIKRLKNNGAVIKNESALYV